MPLEVRTQPLFVQDMAAAMQSRSQRGFDLTVGSVIRAILEAVATMALWLQWQAVQVLSATRASTCRGPDLDSWMADFGLGRLGAVAATGTVVMSRYTAGSGARIPVGALLKSSDGIGRFTVIADPGMASWDGGGYVVQADAVSLTVPIMAEVPGEAGNVDANTITVLATALPGIDAVANPLPLSGGVSGEADDAFRARFAAFLNSRSLATRDAILFAASNAAPGLRLNLIDCADGNGSASIGSFCLVVAGVDGGVPLPTMHLVRVAVEEVRPVGSVYVVKAARVVPVDIEVHADLDTATDRQVALQAIEAAISSWVSGLPVGGRLAVSRVMTLVHQSCPTVQVVHGVVINGGGDLNAAFDEVLSARTVSLL
ncbi:MAG: baseplate J/gp47 family protein [Thermohalobaculum sp.]